jgi:hypothetical protein
MVQSNVKNLIPRASDPVGVIGDIYMNTTTGLMIHNGSSFVLVNSNQVIPPQIRSIAYEDTTAIPTAAVSVSGVTTGTDTGIMTITIPAGEIEEYIIINADIHGNSSANAVTDNSSTTALTTYTIQKTYSAVTVDLLSARTFTQVTANAGYSGSVDRDKDRNSINTSFYYEPTNTEKTNGFDISIALYAEGNSTYSSNSCSSTITVESIRIMGK